jgi:hypothetical protein
MDRLRLDPGALGKALGGTTGGRSYFLSHRVPRRNRILQNSDPTFLPSARAAWAISAYRADRFSSRRAMRPVFGPVGAGGGGAYQAHLVSRRRLPTGPSRRSSARSCCSCTATASAPRVRCASTKPTAPNPSPSTSESSMQPHRHQEFIRFLNLLLSSTKSRR